jgi:hypothetical protein
MQYVLLVVTVSLCKQRRGESRKSDIARCGWALSGLLHLGLVSLSQFDPSQLLPSFTFIIY